MDIQNERKRWILTAGSKEKERRAGKRKGERAESRRMEGGA